MKYKILYILGRKEYPFYVKVMPQNYVNENHPLYKLLRQNQHGSEVHRHIKPWRCHEQPLHRTKAATYHWQQGMMLGKLFLN